MPDDDRVKVTLKLPRVLVRRAKHFSIDHEQDLQDVVTEALQRFLQRKGSR
jgi:hypothetical protein